MLDLLRLLLACVPIAAGLALVVFSVTERSRACSSHRTRGGARQETAGTSFAPGVIAKR
jgi:hypothetical protein